MNTEQERAELLPCLFCGSRNVAQRFTREASFEALSFVECYDCGARGSGVSGHGGEAIEEWNRRAALQSQDREDSERLDWLESSDTSHGFCHTGYGEYRYYAHQQTGMPTVREAIDHARRVEGEEK